jgi:hypothetical protein
MRRTIGEALVLEMLSANDEATVFVADTRLREDRLW